MYASMMKAIALTAAEQAIYENGCKSVDDVDCYVDGIEQFHGKEIADLAREFIIDLLPR